MILITYMEHYGCTSTLLVDDYFGINFIFSLKEMFFSETRDSFFLLGMNLEKVLVDWGLFLANLFFGDKDHKLVLLVWQHPEARHDFVIRFSNCKILLFPFEIYDRSC